MTRYKSRHSIWLKIISTVVLCLFSVNTVLWAYPDSKSADSNTLRPQSIFQPLRDSGIQDSAELAFEILTGIRLLHAGKTYSAVNGILTETYKNSHDKRKIEFLPGTERTNGQTIAKFKVIGQEDVVFEIKYHGTKNDVIEITKIVSTPKTSSNLSKNRTLRGQEYKFLYEIRENPEKFGALSLAYSQLKFGRTVETREFSSQLAEAISADMGNELDRNREDWIVVSPGGYGVPNAAYNLAKNVAGQLSLPHISLAAPITKNRDLQNKLASVARGKDWRLLVHNRKGMKENFSLNGKKVIFIDDSILSGTILDSDSDYLLKAGVVRLQPYILAKLIPKENRNFERVVDLQILKRIGPRALVSIFNDPESIYTTRLVYYTFQLDDREFNRLIDLLTPTARLNLYLYSIEYFDAKSPAKIYRLIKLIENDLKVKLPGSQEFNNMHQNIFYETVIKMIRGYGYHVPCEAAATVSKKLWHYLNIYANKPSAKVVLFDLDKTLSFSSAYYDAVKQATLDFLLSRFGIAAEETQTRIDNLRENLKRKNLPMQQSDIAHEFGVDFQTFDEEIVKRIDSSKYIKPDLELIQLLQELKDAGISLGILSNSGSSQTRRILSSLGVLHLFDNVLTADVAGDFKPDKKFFYSALSRFGVKPQEAVMVGDSYEMDIKPASEIGMKTLNIHSVEDLFDIWHIVFQSADTTLSDSALSDFRVSLQSMAAEQDLTMFEKALSQYDLGEIIDVKILRHSEYRNGIKVLSVETEKGRYVLRKYPFVLAEEQLNKMGQQRQYLRQNDFPILLIDEVKTRDGQKHAIVGDYSYILYSAAGRNLRQEEKTIDESIGKAAQTLAYYHNSAGSLNISSKRVSGNYSIPFEDLPCLRNNLHDFAGKISCMDNSYRMTRARTLFIDSIYQRALETQIERLIAELPPSLYGRLKKIAIHGDFNTKNILVDDRGDPIALIDFDDAMMESRLKDIVHNFFAWLYSYQTELKRPLTSQDIMRFMHDFLETYILALDNANVLSSDEILALRAYLRGSLIYEIFYRVDLLTHQDPEDYFNSDKGDSRFFEEMSRAMDYLLLLDGLNFQELEESLNKTLKAKIRIREALESFSKDGKDVLLVPEDIVLTKAAVDKELDLMFLRKAYHLQIDLIIQRKLQQAIKLEADADKLIPSDPAKASMYLNSTKNALERISVASGFEKKYIDEYARINRKIEALSFSNYSLKPRDRRDHIILIPTKDRSISLQRLLQSAYDELKIFNFGKYDQQHKIVFTIIDDSTKSHDMDANRRIIGKYRTLLAELSPNYGVQYWDNKRQESELDRINQETFSGNWDIRGMLYPHEEGGLYKKKGYAGVRNLGLIIAHREMQMFDNPDDALITWIDDDSQFGTTVIHRDGAREFGVHAINYFQKTQHAFASQDQGIGMLLGPTTHDSTNAIGQLGTMGDLLTAFENASTGDSDQQHTPVVTPLSVLSGERREGAGASAPYLPNFGVPVPLSESDYLLQALISFSEFSNGRFPFRLISYLPQYQSSVDNDEVPITGSQKMGGGDNTSILLGAFSEMMPYMLGIERGEDLFKNIIDSSVLKNGYDLVNTKGNPVDHHRLSQGRIDMLNEIYNHYLGVTRVRLFGTFIKKILLKKAPEMFNEQQEVFLRLEHIGKFNPEWLNELTAPEKYIDFSDWQAAEAQNYNYIKKFVEQAQQVARTIRKRGYLTDVSNPAYYWLRDTRFSEAIKILERDFVSVFERDEVIPQMEQKHREWVNNSENEHYQSFIRKIKGYGENLQRWRQYWDHRDDLKGKDTREEDRSISLKTTSAQGDKIRLQAENNDEKYLLAKTSRYLKDHPVNMSIDLTTIPRGGLTEEQQAEQLDQNMETLARLIAWHNMFGLNTRYILEHGADSDYKDRAFAMLKDKLMKLGAIPGIDVNELLLHIGPPHTGGGVIEVSLKSLGNIKKIQSIPDNAYYVALKDDAEKTGVPMPNYTAAANMGLSLAALRIAKEKSKEKNEYNELRDKVLKVFRSIYKRYEVVTEEEKFTADELELMVTGSSNTRLYYTVLYALPPIVKAAIEELKKYHESLHLLLQAA